MAAHATTPFRVGGKYNFRNQHERLAYMGPRHYAGDRRTWHQFEKVSAPGIVWCEVTDGDLPHFEESESTASAP